MAKQQCSDGASTEQNPKMNQRWREMGQNLVKRVGRKQSDDGGLLLRRNRRRRWFVVEKEQTTAAACAKKETGGGGLFVWSRWKVGRSWYHVS